MKERRAKRRKQKTSFAIHLHYVLKHAARGDENDVDIMEICSQGERKLIRRRGEEAFHNPSNPIEKEALELNLMCECLPAEFPFVGVCGRAFR